LNYKKLDIRQENADKWEADTIHLAEDEWLDGKDLFQCDLILKHKFNNNSIVVFGIKNSDDYTFLNYMSLDKITAEDNSLLNDDFVVKDIDSAKNIVEKTINHLNFKEINIYEYIEDQLSSRQLEISDNEEKDVSDQVSSPVSDRQLETAQKTGYVQGVCESVLAFNNDENRKIMTEATKTFLSKKLLSEMNVTKDMVQKFANPDTYKALEKCVFAQNQE